MSKVVQFLEALGASPSMSSAVNYAQAVETLGLDPDWREALLAHDVSALHRLLSGRSAMRCFIAVPD